MLTPRTISLLWKRRGSYKINNGCLKILRRSFCAEPDPVLFETIGDKGVMTFNRPKKLNTCSLPMVAMIGPQLKKWEDKLTMVIARGQGRAYCAGGDVVYLTKDGPKAADQKKEFFYKEYTMNGIIGYYKIPYVALIDGITMGGGVGLSVHGKVRVATERTLFAMPETMIGLFPDVGTSYFLSRLPNHLGQFFGLTGHRLKGTDVAKAGVATHYINSKDIESLYQGLLELKNPAADLEKFLKNNTEDLSKVEFSLEPYIKKIDYWFSAPTVEEILQRLESDGSNFAIELLENLKKMSPISMKISRKLVDDCKDKSLEECLKIDYRLANSAIEAKVSRDFFEGVRALLIDKDQNPKWDPPTLEEVSDEMVNAAFNKLPPDLELKF